MPDRKRINLYFTDEEDEELYGRIAAIAAAEKRSISQTAKLLILAALARGSVSSVPTPTTTDRTQPPPPTPDNGEASQQSPSPKQGQRQVSKRGKGKES